jgi:hypothetical protein
MSTGVSRPSQSLDRVFVSVRARWSRSPVTTMPLLIPLCIANEWPPLFVLRRGREVRALGERRRALTAEPRIGGGWCGALRTQTGAGHAVRFDPRLRRWLKRCPFGR